MASSSAAEAYSLSRYADPAILSLIPRLELCDASIFQKSSPAGIGAYGDVFRGRTVVEGKGETSIAAKRLRFHVNLSDIKSVRSAICRMSYDLNLEILLGI